MKVSSIAKLIRVVGDRIWSVNAVGIGTSQPESFTKMPISYDVAFGGVDDFHDDDENRDAYMLNPVGKGFHRFLDSGLIHNTPLPNTEELDVVVSHPSGK